MAVVRNSSLEDQEGLRVVIADPCKVEELMPALAGQDAVISCLGQRPGGNPWLLRDAVVATLQTMQQAGIKRFVIVSGALLYPSHSPLVLLLKRALAERLMDGRAAEQVVTASNANWSIVRPPRLQEGSSNKGYRIKTGAHPKLTWSLQFRDLQKSLDLPQHAALFAKKQIVMRPRKLNDVSGSISALQIRFPAMDEPE